MFAVCPGKGGIIVKTTGITGGGDGFPLGDLISCQQKALRGQIVSDRITGFFLEGMHEMIPAQIEMFGKKVDGDVMLNVHLNNLSHGSFYDLRLW